MIIMNLDGKEILPKGS